MRSENILSVISSSARKSKSLFTAQFYSEYLQQSGNGRPRSLGDDVVCGGCIFALAMSLDGMFGGLGAGFTGKNIYFTVMGSFVVSFCAVLCGCRIGMQASKRWKTDVSWLGGVLFVILAFQKII